MNKKRKKVDEVKNIKEVCDMPLRKYMTSKRRKCDYYKTTQHKTFADSLELQWHFKQTQLVSK